MCPRARLCCCVRCGEAEEGGLSTHELYNVLQFPPSCPVLLLDLCCRPQQAFDGTHIRLSTLVPPHADCSSEEAFGASLESVVEPCSPRQGGKVAQQTEGVASPIIPVEFLSSPKERWTRKGEFSHIVLLVDPSSR